MMWKKFRWTGSSPGWTLLFIFFGFLGAGLHAQSGAAVNTDALHAFVFSDGEKGSTLILDRGMQVAEIFPAIFGEAWTFNSIAKNGKFSGDHWIVPLPHGCDVSVSISVTVLSSGLHFIYSMTPSKSVKLMALQVQVAFPYPDWQGSPYHLGDHTGLVPLTPASNVILAETDLPLTSVGPSTTRKGLIVSLSDNSLHAMLQDARQWGGKMNLLLSHGESGASPWLWTQGARKVFEFSISVNRPTITYNELLQGPRALEREASIALWNDHDFEKASGFYKAALANHPDDYENNLNYGMAWMSYAQPPNFKEAEKYILMASKKQKNVFNQYLLGLAARGAQDWKLREDCSIEVANLFRAGKDRDVQIDPPDLDFGRRQYLAILDRLPAMKSYVPKEAWLSKWAMESLGGVGLRTKVLWDSSAPPLPTNAETEDEADGWGNMRLFINPVIPNQGSFQAGECYWHSLIFELLNDQHRERSTWIWMRSRSAKLSDSEYAALNRSFEQQTDLETSRFYFEHWKPYCDSMGLKTDPALWSPANPFPEEAIYKVFTRYDKAYLDPDKK
jgi:hypothetical protein